MATYVSEVYGRRTMERVRVTLLLLKHHYRRVVPSPVPTRAAIGCPVLRDDTVLWSVSALRSPINGSP
ncbi:hypothetical protein K443DRAFT_681254 [Laccaria amethystina LaAM-08-1]|uniref:Uncharacterized protein n=1 Tax=Laccaria amethystina LaAM-08-1 TaxID=1095629 RepID=A0A0C9XJP1_9AGAR|nr:hypothetical protein K443DRAFT_681254 [Laccaria amethystina LaAM-08-1]